MTNLKFVIHLVPNVASISLVTSSFNYHHVFLMAHTSTLISGDSYYALGNIRPELRSTQRAIQLTACVRSECITKYGFQPVLASFIEDVKTLAEVSTIPKCTALLLANYNLTGYCTLLRLHNKNDEQ